jgi:glycosyltransferase involved in cell wall biosynthesis
VPNEKRRLHAVGDTPKNPSPRLELLIDLERQLPSGRISRPDFERWQPVAAGPAELPKAVANSARTQMAQATAAVAVAGAVATKALTRIGIVRRAPGLLLRAAVLGWHAPRRAPEVAARASLALRAHAQRGAHLAAPIPAAADHLAGRAGPAARRLYRGAVVVARGLRRLWPVLIAFLIVAGIVAAAVIEISSTSSALYTLFVCAALLLGAIGWTTLAWMLDAWRNPEALAATRLQPDELEPRLSFSLIVPARHEEAVLATTLSRLVTADHPNFEIVVVVGDDDPETASVAERVAARHPELVRVVVDTNPTKNKPRALNTGLPHCSGEVVGVFDAEDDVHPGLLKRVDQRFQRTAADVVQAGVQLMNFSSSWFAVRNVLEYYFWFRSRLHVHARQGFIPLGGNTVFVRTEVLRAVGGWDADCLTEDCELGVRLSSLGARTVVVYEPELVTREECPPTLGSFMRQRTRWNQGFLQTLAKGYWHRLPLSQQALGIYILAMPYLMALAWLMIPAALVTAIIVTAPVPITLISILPALPMVSILAVELVGLHDFCGMYKERATARDYLRLIVGLPFYQVVISFAAVRAVVREALGLREWEKTMHFGFHLALQPSGPGKRITEWPRIPSRRSRLAQRRPERPAPPVGREPVGETPPSESLAPRIPLISVYANALAPAEPAGGDALEEARRKYRFTPTAALAAAGSAGAGSLPVDGLVGYGDGHPLLARLHAAAAGGMAGRVPVLPLRDRDAAAGGRSPAAWLRRRLGRVAAARIDLAIVVPLLVALGLVQATNTLHWPGSAFDEGTYVSDAWAVANHGVLSNYTYGYGHPPLGWLLITLWTCATNPWHAMFSVDGGREFMVLVGLVTSWLVYVLARRLGLQRAFAVLAVVLFALSPLGLYFHRLVLLDNLATAWAVAAFALALTPRNRLWAYAGSGACFAATVLCKETTLVLLPALVLVVLQHANRVTRRYCVALFATFFLLFAAAYPLYATLKGELVPGRGHVSLLGYVGVQLFSRRGTGSIFDPTSNAHGIVAAWLHLDPWLIVSALVLAPFALFRRRMRAIVLAYLIQVGMILRPGYLPNMYVIVWLPFAALIVAATADGLWRVWTTRGAELVPRDSEGRRRLLSEAAVLLRPAAAASAALVLAASAVASAAVVMPQWIKTDRQATSLRLDGPQRATERWLVRHVGHDQRLIVTDQIWLYLIEHGFNSQPVKGGFFSRTVVFYWTLDYDPAVKQAFPDGWRDFDYVVSNYDLRITAYLNPTTEAALAHSHPVATFGHGPYQIQVRKIGHPSGPQNARTAAKKHRHDSTKTVEHPAGVPRPDR